jgi:hypothetical protein
MDVWFLGFLNRSLYPSLACGMGHSFFCSFLFVFQILFIMIRFPYDRRPIKLLFDDGRVLCYSGPQRFSGILVIVLQRSHLVELYLQ